MSSGIFSQRGVDCFRTGGVGEFPYILIHKLVDNAFNFNFLFCLSLRTVRTVSEFLLYISLLSPIGKS
jgi:hypothetical protein